MFEVLWVPQCEDLRKERPVRLSVEIDRTRMETSQNGGEVIDGGDGRVVASVLAEDLPALRDRGGRETLLRLRALDCAGCSRTSVVDEQQIVVMQ